jgi:hypothetical protein
LAVVLAAIGGCPPVDTVLPRQTDSGEWPPEDYDGMWQLTPTGWGSGTSCLSVVDGSVAEVDDGCRGNYFELSRAEPAIVTGNHVVWRYEAKPAWWPTVVQWTIDVTGPTEGPLHGTWTTYLGYGIPTSDEIMLTRR